MTVLAWFRRRRASPAPASAPELAPAIAPSAAAFDRATRWFAGEPPALVELAHDTLRALAPAAPRPAEGVPPFPPDFGWLDAAFARLAALPEPLAPPGADDLAWRYLTFARALCDALEAAHADALRAALAPPEPEIALALLGHHAEAEDWRDVLRLLAVCRRLQYGARSGGGDLWRRDARQRG